MNETEDEKRALVESSIGWLMAHKESIENDEDYEPGEDGEWDEAEEVALLVNKLGEAFGIDVSCWQ